MKQFVFTLDYEIYGNGAGSLRELVIEPTQRLAEVMAQYAAPLVVFAEAVEFPKIENAGSDPDSAGVREQLRALRAAGHEIGLHLHPWWANARYEGGEWRLDWSERNICSLQPDRVEVIVSGAISYLRDALNEPAFTPVSFRSGLWVMQPTPVIAATLTRHGVRVDSSVFKGGRIDALELDYSSAAANPEFWRFADDVTTPDPQGRLWEFPIHTQLVPFWEMLGRKRRMIQQQVPRAAHGTPLPRRWRDFLRMRYPRKLDFCRMTFEEMRRTLEGVLGESPKDPGSFHPVVGIGHSKDLVDFDAIERLLKYLRRVGASVTTFSRLLSPGLGLTS